MTNPVIGPVGLYDPQSVFFRTEKNAFYANESVLQTKNLSEPAKNRFSVALPQTLDMIPHPVTLS